MLLTEKYLYLLLYTCDSILEHNLWTTMSNLEAFCHSAIAIPCRAKSPCKNEAYNYSPWYSGQVKNILDSYLGTPDIVTNVTIVNLIIFVLSFVILNCLH